MKLRRLASTRDTFHGEFDTAVRRETGLHASLIERQKGTEYTYPELQQPCKSPSHRTYNTTSRLQWLCDGSSLFSVSDDNALRVYLTSPSLLEDDNELLVPFTRSFQSVPIIATEVHPEASPYNGSCQVLVSSNDVPLKLIDLVPSKSDGKSTTLFSYDTLHSQTEQYFKISSAKFTSNTTFAAGTNKKVLLFDVNRADILNILDCKGIVSCFGDVGNEFSQTGSLYTGTFNNWITMFDNDGTPIMEQKVGDGNGISQILESKNGKFVFVMTRNSQSIKVLDVRMGLQMVGELPNFKSGSQRLFGDLLPRSQGLIIGSSYGNMNLYDDAEMAEPSLKSIQISNETSIPSVTVNPNDPNVIAYSLGDRDYDKPSINISYIDY